jgi:hypothetical protein
MVGVCREEPLEDGKFAPVVAAASVDGGAVFKLHGALL